MKAIKMYAAVAILLFTISCKKNNSGTIVNPSPSNPSTAIKDVYVAGYAINSIGKNVAKYWKNNIAVNLSDGSRDAVARSIFVDGNDIYVAGSQDKVGSNLNYATYWKNGAATSLNSTGTGGPFDVANSIFISGGNIYAAGLERASSGNDIAKYWKNGTPVNLTDGTKDADAQSIFIVGTDIYVAGSEASSTSNSNSIAKYWKNGVAISLTDGSTSASAMAIIVVGNDVYVAGTMDDASGYSKTVYWKNGAITTLTNGSEDAYGFCIAVSGSDIYVGGKNGNAAVQSGYWKNNQAGFSGLVPAANYQLGQETLGGIAIAGTDIYAVGSYHNGSNQQAVLWKNGTPQNLGTSGFHSGCNGIFLTYQ